MLQHYRCKRLIGGRLKTVILVETVAWRRLRGWLESGSKSDQSRKARQARRRAARFIQ
ncbi:hypothetical protein MPLA_70017 [Mesorhizobium sp. ORS 3359]|nr:hypothetical protein MPLA_70017 [Mesorhizobium sp. ORS 3359]